MDQPPGRDGDSPAPRAAPADAPSVSPMVGACTPHGPLYRRQATGGVEATVVSAAPISSPGQGPGSITAPPLRADAALEGPLRVDRCDDRVQMFRKGDSPAPMVEAPTASLAVATSPVGAVVPAVAEQPVVPVGPVALGAPAAVPQAPPVSQGSPPAVLPPSGRAEFSVEPTEPATRNFGSASDPGPPAADADKGNQDFAFHLELFARDKAAWAVAGVADGVSQATWSARGARHVSAAFIEATTELLASEDQPGTADALAGDRWSHRLAEVFQRRVLERFEQDRDLLLEGRYVDPMWAADLFAKTFWSGPHAGRETKKWFQSTLLAAALGPEGGFALLLGDGFVRIDRRTPSGAWESSAGLEPSRMISFGLTKQEVFGCIVRVARKQAVRLGVMMTTDGVSKSPVAGLESAAAPLARLPGGRSGGPLETIAPASSGECASFLRRLATQPAGMVDVDNMSVAFLSRDVAPVPPG